MKPTIDLRRFSISQTKATKTIVLSSLLLIASLAMIPLLSISVTAAGPTLTVSPTAGHADLRDGTLFGPNDPYLGAPTVILTGTGFPAGQDDITLRIADPSVAISNTAGNQLYWSKVSFPGTGYQIQVCEDPGFFGQYAWGISPITPNPANGNQAGSGQVHGGIYYLGDQILADGMGNFKIAFPVPQLRAQQYNIWAVYTPTGGSPTTTSPVLFTVQAGMALIEEQSQTNAGVFNSKVHVLLSGFDGSEMVSIVPTSFLMKNPWESTSGAPTPSFSSFSVMAGPIYNGGVSGRSGGGSTSLLTDNSNVGYIGNTVGGTITVTAFGASSGIVVSTTFTLNPSIAIMTAPEVLTPSIQGQTSNMISASDVKLSVPINPSTIYVSIRNWLSAVSVPANSLQIMSSTQTFITAHNAFTTSSSGSWDNIGVTYFSTLPTTPLSLIFNGVTFSLSSGNIVATDTLRAAEQSIAPRIAAKLFPSASSNIDMQIPLAGALIASSSTGSVPPYVTLTAGSVFMHSAGEARSLVYVYAVDGIANSPWGMDEDVAGLHMTLMGQTMTDANGAGLAFIWKLPAANTTYPSIWARDFYPSESPYYDHLLTTTGAITGVQTTLYIRPYINPTDGDPTGQPGWPTPPTWGWTLGNRGYREQTTLRGYGFKAGEAISITIGTTTWFSFTVTPDAAGNLNTNATLAFTPTKSTLITDFIPKVPYGNWPVTFGSSTTGNSFTRTIKMRPDVIMDPTAPAGYQEALTTYSTSAGNPDLLRSATTIGVFGLKANTAYSVQIGGVSVGTFTSASDGSITSGVSFRVPSVAAGLYYVDIVDSTGTSAIFNLPRYGGDQFTSRRSGFHIGSLNDFPYVLNEYPTPSNGLPTPVATPAFYRNIGESSITPGAGTGLRISISLSLTIFPATTYPTSNVTVTGSGLSPNTQYYVTLSDSSTSLHGIYVGYVLATFVSTSGGAVPSNVKVMIPDVPNSVEPGTQWYLHASDSTDLEGLTSSGHGTITLTAYLAITPTSGPAGTTVTYAGHGFGNTKTYPVYFNYVSSTYPGLQIGSISSDSYGTTSGTLIIPSIATGTYNIQLYNTTTGMWNILDIEPTFTVSGGAVTGPGGPIGTGTFTPTSPNLLSSSGTVISTVPRSTGFFVQLQLASNIGSPLSVYAIAQIKDASGTVVAIGLTAADVGAGATKSVPIAFTGISGPGTYTATIFVWDGIKSPTPLAPTSVLVITVT